MRGLCGTGVFLWAALIAGIVVLAGAQYMPAPIVNPPGVRLHLDITDAGPFRDMQMVRGTIQLDWEQVPASADGSEAIWSLSGYLVDPPLGEGAQRCGVPERPCARNPHEAISDGHFWGGDTPWQDGPRPLRITELLPPLPPGSYRIAGAATRNQVYRGEEPAMPRMPPPAVMVISNWVSLTILPVSDDWIQQTLTRNSPSPHPPPPDEGREAHRAWLDSIHQLHLLDHPSAWQRIASLQLAGNPATLEGLQSTRLPEQACVWMRQGLDDTRRRVDSLYLRTTGVVCSRAELPPSPRPPLSGTTLSPEDSATMHAYFERQQEWHRQQIETDGARLLASLSEREGRVLADGLIALLDLVPTAQELNQLSQAQASGQPQAKIASVHSSRFFFGPFRAARAEPSWAPRFRQGLPQWIAALDPELRTGLLNRVLHHMESPEWVAVIEAELRQLNAADASDTARHLLHSLAAMDAKRAANLIVAELRKPETWLQPEMLGLVPVEPRPFADEELVQMLAERGVPGGSEMLWHAAVARFASPEAAPRLRELYEQRLPACQAALVGYFVRADPDYAASILGSNWEMGGSPPRCRWEYLKHTATYGMGPVLEKFLTAHLFHSGVPMKDAAARSLQMHGSAAAQDALWEAMRHFHQYWKGRETELSQNHEGASFEMTLALALLGARNWTMAPEGIQQLRALCTGIQCMQIIGNTLSAWQQPLLVYAAEAHGRFDGRVAQYNPATREELLTRISQLPEGTRIRIAVGAPDAESLRSAIRSQAISARLVVE